MNVSNQIVFLYVETCVMYQVARKKFLVCCCIFSLVFSKRLLWKSIGEENKSTATSEKTMSARVDRLQRFCSQHPELTRGKLSAKVENRLRFVPDWNLLYCENYKVRKRYPCCCLTRKTYIIWCWKKNFHNRHSNEKIRYATAEIVFLNSRNLSVS